jgi:hypothetical protein
MIGKYMWGAIMVGLVFADFISYRLLGILDVELALIKIGLTVVICATGILYSHIKALK